MTFKITTPMRQKDFKKSVYVKTKDNDIQQTDEKFRLTFAGKNNNSNESKSDGDCNSEDSATFSLLKKPSIQMEERNETLYEFENAKEDATQFENKMRSSCTFDGAGVVYQNKGNAKTKGSVCLLSSQDSVSKTDNKFTSFDVKLP